MGIKNITCIGCPLGCSLEVLVEGNKVLSVKGHLCNRGEKYGSLECTDPRRVITSTVRVEEGEVNSISVKSEKAIPKNRIFDCIRELKKVTLKAPIKIGEVVIENILDTGIDIVSTKNVKKKLS